MNASLPLKVQVSMSDTQAQRRALLQEALANASLEGLEPTAEDLHDLEPYLRGEESIEEFLAKLRGRYSNPRNTPSN